MRDCPPFQLSELEHADETATFFPSYYIPSREKIYSYLKVAGYILLVILGIWAGVKLVYMLPPMSRTPHRKQYREWANIDYGFKERKPMRFRTMPHSDVHPEERFRTMPHSDVHPEESTQKDTLPKTSAVETQYQEWSDFGYGFKEGKPMRSRTVPHSDVYPEESTQKENGFKHGKRMQSRTVPQFDVDAEEGHQEGNGFKEEKPIKSRTVPQFDVDAEEGHQEGNGFEAGKQMSPQESPQENDANESRDLSKKEKDVIEEIEQLKKKLADQVAWLAATHEELKACNTKLKLIEEKGNGNKWLSKTIFVFDIDSSSKI